VRLLDAAQVRAALDLDALVDELARAFVAVSDGTVSAPGRVAVEAPAVGGSLLLMGAHTHGSPTLTAKLVGIFPANAQRGMATHQALVAVLDAETGAARALLDGEVITQARTAAASRLATRLLAQRDDGHLAVIGAGAQARAHVEALTRERAFARVVIAARRPEAARALAAELGAEAADARTAVDGAAVVCLATSAAEPVIRRAWLTPGAHVNSVGFSFSGGELDPALASDAFVAVESRAATLAPPPAGAADLQGLAEPPAELGELVTGRATPPPGRTTVYKSVGLAVEDDVAARLALARAEALGLGTVVEL
jgi:ornithine cyclodeaminase/alanine dehydrogenase-like protein (mu-crystallin family)